MNEKEKKAIEELSKKAVFCNYEERDYPNMICFKKDMLIVLNLIEKLQKENEKLRKQLNEENKRCMMLAIEKQDYFEKYRYNLQQNESLTKEFSNFIPIQKIKDKIEELNQYYKKEIYPSLYQWGDKTITEHYDEMIGLLQELLGDK